MRVAVITDVHGNIHALEAILYDLETQGIDELVIAGDTVNILPNSKACWDRVMALGCPVLKGNHEFYLYAYGTPSAPHEWSQERFKGLAWLQGHFSEDDLAAMATLAMTYKLPDLLVTHASPRSLFDSIKEDTPEATLREMFSNVNEPLIIRGHNHKWYEHRWNTHTVVTVNSCGFPLTGRLEAQYLLLERRERWHYEKRFIPYDLEAALETMDEDYLEHMGPLGLIFKVELRTGVNHLLPFLAQYLEPIDRGELPLARAVELFLDG